MKAAPATLTVNGAPLAGRPVLGSFGKGCAGSAALSFARSGGVNCARSCDHHPANGGTCYAVNVERHPHRQNVSPKLERHELAGADAVVEAAIREAASHAYRFPWFRVSVFGSVPGRVPRRFRELVQRLRDAGTPVHLPIEDRRKAARYREALAGTGVAVRWSIPPRSRRTWLAYPDACSTVAGSMSDRVRVRIRDARRVAADRREATGRRVVACPAAIASLLKRKTSGAACGACTACAEPDTDVVYPVHA